MPKHILFIIHGMGVHESGWEKEVTKTLSESAGRFEAFKQIPLENRIDFVPISYDDIITDVLERWKSDAGGILSFANSNQFELGEGGQEALEWLAKADTEKNFFWSHVSDVLIYRLSSHYRELIRSKVIKTMAERIDRGLSQYGNAFASVLAHSLGTAVMHDSIHFMGTRRWGGATNLFGPTHWRFQSIFMIANTARVLQSNINVYDESIVKPGPNLDPASYCVNYLNFRHEFDPIPFPRMFKPTEWDESSYRDLSQLNHFRDWNIHGFEHYLLNPHVHIPILRMIAGRRTISRDEEKEAIEDFPQFTIDSDKTPLIKEVFDQLKDIIRNISVEPSILEWTKLIMNAYLKMNVLRGIIG